MIDDTADRGERLQTHTHRHTPGSVSCRWFTPCEVSRAPAVYLVDCASSPQKKLLVLLADLDVVDLVLVVDHQGERLIGLLPFAVPHQVCPILDTHTDTHKYKSGLMAA